jgi:hypothetical protein
MKGRTIPLGTKVTLGGQVNHWGQTSPLGVVKNWPQVGFGQKRGQSELGLGLI